MDQEKLALARDGDKCCRCLGEAAVCHRRIPGTDCGLANIICLCKPCHQWVHENPADAYGTGFLLHYWENPESIPLMVKPGSCWVTLTNSGDMKVTQQLTLF